MTQIAEIERLERERRREANWKRWGPYLSERQWGTVREDYSHDNESWDDFPHEHARSRAYRWGEDGLLGICDRQCRLCFALALHNGRDPILKERLFGLTGPQGNHGEDVKECYYYLDATPTSSYLKGLYKYPQSAYPYQRLLDENQRRSKQEPELELEHTGVFDDNRYFDVVAEYAKAGPNDILVRITITNRGPEDADISVLPTLWYRNNWSWGRDGEGYDEEPSIVTRGAGVVATHESLGAFRLDAEDADAWLFTDNETNRRKLFDQEGPRHCKDAFHDYLVAGDTDAVRDGRGTKVAALYQRSVPAGGSVTLRLRLRHATEEPTAPFEAFDAQIAKRIAEADAFYDDAIPSELSQEERLVSRQAYAGLLWTKQFYYYVVKEWLEGDPTQPKPPPDRWSGRNHGWTHLYNRDVISMPDKWEYPWYAAWDLAFHMIPMARIDPEFAKQQLMLFLREWYMHPNGAIPAYEFALGDVNPPVHAWAVWRVYKMSAARGKRDVTFLARAFQKLLLNFTWWVNRTDADGNNLFSGGFLGLDNIGVFDRSRQLPGGGELEQADGSAWMAFYCSTMMSMALELASHDAAYEDMASKFLEHFVAIAEAMNAFGGHGLWDDDDAFYYDQLHLGDACIPLKIRSMVGLIPLFACALVDEDMIARMPGFTKRMRWFMNHRGDLARHICYMEEDPDTHEQLMLAIPPRERLVRVLAYMLDEDEFLSPYGVRALSRFHEDHPYVLRMGGKEHVVRYNPGDSDSFMFGGNSNWRGPVWFPVNWLLIESLERYHHFYGDTLEVECPTGSGNLMNLQEVATEIATRLSRLFTAQNGERASHGGADLYQQPGCRDLVLFYEYFHGNDGRGLGASHQTGWTALVATCLEVVGQARQRARST